MDIVTLLKKEKVPFEIVKHRPTFTAQELAAVEHTSGDRVAKVVVVKDKGGFRMLVLPASYSIRFDRVNELLGTKDARLATEEEMSELFSDCELGAMPPFGRQYALEVYADQHLAEGRDIIFEAGHHDEAIRMKWSDYEKLERPKIVDFASHLR